MTPPDLKSPGTSGTSLAASTGTFLGQDPADTKFPWPEWKLQAYIATQSHRAGFTFAAGMEGASKSKSTAGRSKATGQAAGEPDLRYYLPNGKLVMIELKTASGKLTPSQKQRIPKLRELGYNVCVVYAQSPIHGWESVRNILVNGIINVGDLGQ